MMLNRRACWLSTRRDPFDGALRDRGVVASPFEMLVSTVIQNFPTRGRRKFPYPWLKTSMK